MPERLPGIPGYTIRIIKPEAVVSSLETRVFTTLEETEYPLVQLRGKLDVAGIGDYVIHVVNQETGATERTFTRKEEYATGSKPNDQ